MENLIKNIHSQYRLVSRGIESNLMSRKLTNLARKYKECKVFRGNESLQELCEKLLSPQGIEFCLENSFPNLVSFRAFKPYEVEQFGVYIDAGRITLTNPKKVMLVGKTIAVIECNDTESHEISMMHGAVATVLCSGWSVTRINAGRGTSVVKRASENAIILG